MSTMHTDGSSAKPPRTASAQRRIIKVGTLGGVNTLALAINESGQIVGWSPAPERKDAYHAFVWQCPASGNW